MRGAIRANRLCKNTRKSKTHRRQRTSGMCCSLPASTEFTAVASKVPAVLPAGPPPTITMSKNSAMIVAQPSPIVNHVAWLCQPEDYACHASLGQTGFDREEVRVCLSLNSVLFRFQV